MIYAQKRLKVGHDEATDTPIYREAGEVVPEAASWSWQILHTYEHAGYIKVIPDALPREAVDALKPAASGKRGSK